MTTRDVLERLLAATPSPPAGADPEALLVLLAEALPERQAILAELGPTPLRLDDAERMLADEIIARQGAWGAALARARDALGAARIGTTKLRHYAPAPGR